MKKQKDKQFHESRLLEASLVWQADGKLKKEEILLFVECFSFIIDDDEVPLPRGGARRHGEQRHTKGSFCIK